MSEAEKLELQQALLRLDRKLDTLITNVEQNERDIGELRLNMAALTKVVRDRDG